MPDNNPLFLDYVEIRRRIESRLSARQAILAHIVLFNIAVIALFIFTATIFNPALGYPYVPRSHFVDVNASYLITLWSILLLGHGVWAYRRSGASGGARTEAVDDELKQRMEHEDTELLENPRQAFRLQALLNDDIRGRAGVFVPIMIFLMFNAVTWAAWAVQGAFSSYTWTLTLPTTLVFLLPPLAINAWRRKRRNRHILRVLSDREAFSAPLKPKRTLDEEVSYRLSDDGELVEILEDFSAPDERNSKI